MTEQRQQNFEGILAMVDSIFQKLGSRASAAPLKTLVQVSQYASLEQDEHLQNCWAALLANSALDHARVLPSYPEILRQLSVIEAKFLAAIYRRVCAILASESPQASDDPDTVAWIDIGPWQSMLEIFAEAGLATQSYSDLIDPEKRHEPAIVQDHTLYNMARDNLIRSHLIQRNSKIVTDGKPRLRDKDHYSLTALGFQFVGACQRPDHKS